MRVLRGYVLTCSPRVKIPQGWFGVDQRAAPRVGDGRPSGPPRPRPFSRDAGPIGRLAHRPTPAGTESALTESSEDAALGPSPRSVAGSDSRGRDPQNPTVGVGATEEIGSL